MNTSTPHGTKKVARPRAEVVEDVEWLLECDPWVTSWNLAHRLGYRDATAIQNALAKAGRRDLLEKLNRNAKEFS